MSTMKMTLIGIENYYNKSNRSLFSDIILPDGIDKDILINSILLESSEYEVLYSNPNFLKSMIELFFKKNNWTFTKWIEALNIEYDPLENYNRFEDWSDKADYKNESKSEGNIKGHSNSSNDTTGEDNVSAFDSDGYQPKSQNKANSKSDVDSTSDSKNSDESKGNNNSIHNGRIHGNIGVTTSQQMLEAELDIVRWNIYKHISDMFISDFCILVY